jgi:transposase
MAHAASRHPRDLTDHQWNTIGRFLPKLPRRQDGRGRPWRENRSVLNGILWILRTGAPWADLPARYPSHQTCHRRFQRWVRAGVLRTVLEILAQALHDEGYLNLQEAFIDGSFAPAKRGGAGVGKTKRGKGSKIMAIADRQGRPVAVHVESATPHEVNVARTMQRMMNLRITMKPVTPKEGRPYYQADVVNSLPCLAGITEMRDVSPSTVDRLHPQAAGSRTSGQWGFQVDRQLTGSALGGENVLANKARYCNVAGCVNFAGQDPIAETGI